MTRGNRTAPLFIRNMTFKDQVVQLLNDALLEKPEIFFDRHQFQIVTKKLL
jgi:hypothetical protein